MYLNKMSILLEWKIIWCWVILYINKPNCFKKKSEETRIKVFKHIFLMFAHVDYCFSQVQKLLINRTKFHLNITNSYSLNLNHQNRWLWEKSGSENKMIIHKILNNLGFGNLVLFYKSPILSTPVKIKF